MVLQRLPNDWRKGQPPQTTPPIKPAPNVRTRTQKTTRLLELAKLTSPEHERIDPLYREPWCTEVSDLRGQLEVKPAPKGVSKDDGAKAHVLHIQHFERHPQHLLVYSDGSLLRGRAGAGIIGLHKGREVFREKVGLGTSAEVYDTEMMGLMKAATLGIQYAGRHPGRITHIHIYADNNAAIQSIFEANSASGQRYSKVFREAVLEFLQAHKEHRVEVAWAPGHKGVKGNELADKLAKSACDTQTKSNTSRSHALRVSGEVLMRQWKAKWSKGSAGPSRFSIANRFPPSKKPREHFSELPRELYGRVTQARLGHCFSGEYYRTSVPTEPVSCPCGEPRQTRQHIICICNKYNNYRHILCKFSPELVLADILGTTKGISSFAKFLKASGAFTKTGG